MGEIERQRGEIERQIGEIQRWTDRGERHRGRGEKQRDRADNKNPKQSWVAQLVQYNQQIARSGYSFLLKISNTEKLYNVILRMQLCTFGEN